MSPTQLLVQQFYKNRKGEPIILTPTQDRIFQVVAGRLYPRVFCTCHTRFGKSETVGMATLTRLTTYPEKWAIVSGDKDKAGIIMNYVISHIFDNKYTEERFVPDKGESMEEIRKHRNKGHLTFDTGKMVGGKTLLSELTIGSAKAAIGHGAENVILDEGSLVDDDEETLVARMLGDNAKDSFYMKIGNPFRRNHFLDSYKDPNYFKIIADYHVGLREGRLTPEYVEEMRKKMFFSILYECKFPSAKAMDEEGYMNLILEMDLVNAQARKFKEPYGAPRLGVDVAKGGRNYNCWVLRFDNIARVLLKDNEENSVKIAETTLRFMKMQSIAAANVFVDDTGVGHGVVSVLKNLNHNVNAVNFGYAASEKFNERNEKIPSPYLNMRAECYAGEEGLQVWVKHKGALEPNKEWSELKVVRYKRNKAGKTQIEPKEDLIARGGVSPDVADALALTFAKIKRTVYHGIDVEEVLESGAASQFGGVGALIPGIA